MNNRFVDKIIAAYSDLFDPPTQIIRFSRAGLESGECAVMAYVPDEVERLDPFTNMTQMSTAGFGAEVICVDFPCELGLVVQGALDESSAVSLAKEMVELASVPLKTGRLFEDGQVLTGISLSVFSRFEMAMLVDWDAVYGLRFPEPLNEVGILRIVPMFPSEVEFVESCANHKEGYLTLVNRGMVETDPGREPIV